MSPAPRRAMAPPRPTGTPARAPAAWPCSRREFSLALCALFAGNARAQGALPLEDRVKAAFLQKFPEYVEWPDRAAPSPGEPIAVAIVGAPGIATELDRITVDRTAGGRAMVVRRPGVGDAVSGAHMLFVGRDQQQAARPALRAAIQRAVLTVTDTPDGLDDGAIVNFLLVEGRVRFEVALDTAERAGLRISSRMLSVALRVRKA